MLSTLHYHTAMDSATFEYSTKNISLPTREEYILKLIETTELLLKRMRWRAFFYLNPEQQQNNKNTYGFKTRRAPPAITQLSNFEKAMRKLIENIQFRPNNCKFQQQLAKDCRNIKKMDKLLVEADKTANYYKISANDYQRLLTKNITKDYKKVNKNCVNDITTEAKEIACCLEIDDRVTKMPEREAYITFKDHKPNFVNNPACRLINPTKSEIGKIICAQAVKPSTTNYRKHTQVNKYATVKYIIK